MSSSGTSGPAIQITSTDTGGRAYALKSTGSAASAGVGKLAFRDITAAADRMVIDSSGNVGIGVTAPARQFHVGGPMKVAAAALPGSPGAGDIAIDSGDGNKLKYHNGSSWVAPTAGNYAVDCAGTGFIETTCVRIDTSTGASTCRYYSVGTWYNCMNNPFSASASALYDITCSQENSGGGALLCLRTNLLSGATTCSTTASPSFNNWGACPSAPW